jgi:hypothetical protein
MCRDDADPSVDDIGQASRWTAQIRWRGQESQSTTIRLGAKTMTDFNSNDLDRDTVIDTRPVWNTPTVIVAEMNTLTQTAGFSNFDAPTSFGS